MGTQATCRSDPCISRSSCLPRPHVSGGTLVRGSSGPVQPLPDLSEKSHWAQPHASICRSALVASSHGGPEWPLSTAKQEIVSGPSRQSRWTPPENASPQQPPGAPARCPAVLDGRGFGTGRPLGVRLGLGFRALGEAEPLLSDVGTSVEPAPGCLSAGPHLSPQGGALLFPCETWVWNRGSEGMFVARTERRGEEK